MAAHRLIGASLFSVVVLAALPASAGEKSSAYTRLDLDKCREEPPDPDDPLQSGTWWCEGYGGMKVMVTEDDLRYQISYGDQAEDEVAAGQTLPRFNIIGDTVEWRIEKGDDGVLRPYATILRFFTDADVEGGVRGQTLVITKLSGPGQICHMGRVNALLNPDANAMARAAADNGAAEFDCASDNALDYGLTGDDAKE